MSLSTLRFVLDSDADGASASMYFPADVFEPAAVARMLGHVEALLEAAETQPSLPLRRLGLLTKDERRYLLEDWNATTESFSESLSARAPGRRCRKPVGGRRGRRRRLPADIRGTRDRIDEARTTSAAPRRKSRRARRDLRRAVARDARRAARDPEGRGGVRAGRSRHIPSERKAFMLEDAAGTRRRDRGAPCSRLARHRRAGRLSRPRPELDRRRIRRHRRAGLRPGAARVRDLHLRLDRASRRASRSRIARS